jgi:hypothetical protein
MINTIIKLAATGLLAKKAIKPVSFWYTGSEAWVGELGKSLMRTPYSL